MPDSQQNHRRRPLPDAQAISNSGVPEAAPPYDDDVPAARRQHGREHLADGSDREISRRGGLAAATGTWPSQFAQVLSETLAGSRPPSQLRPWTTEQARKRISQLGPMLCAPARGARAGQPRVRRVIASSPVHGVLEMTVIVDVGSRARAVAVRLERPPQAAHGSGAQPGQDARQRRPAPSGGWLCTAIEAA